MATGTIPPALRRSDTIAFVSPSERMKHIYPTHLNRAKSRLEHRGYHVKVILNESKPYDQNMRVQFAQMVKDQCYGTDFPILMDVDVGHTDPILTIPLNALVSFDSAKDEFSILDAGVKSNAAI